MIESSKVCKYILLPPVKTVSQLSVVFICENYILLQKEEEEEGKKKSIYFIKQIEYGNG
jgi:hypothetical protein